MKLVLIGASGYGAIYLSFLLKHHGTDLELAGVVEKYIDRCPKRVDIQAAGIPIYDTLENFFAADFADLTIISTPSFCHCSQTLCALEHGSWVLCEKPAAPAVEEVETMISVAQQQHRWVAIGYQWSYSEAIQSLKTDILSGKLGKPQSMRTFISWPRDKAYYSRGCGWGGRISFGGRPVLDSIASNACAHYLHNLLFLLGPTMSESAYPASAEAQCLRVNEIENFDTCILRMKTTGGATLYFSATHASEVRSDPVFVLEFENAVVSFTNDPGSHIVAKFDDGSEKDYGDPNADEMTKLKDAMACIRSGETPICTAETAIAHTRLINSLYRNCRICDFPEEVRIYRENAVYVRGLWKVLQDAYEHLEMVSLPYAEICKLF